MSLRSVLVAPRIGAAGALFLARRLQRHGIRWLLMALLAAVVSVGPQGAWSMAGLGTPGVAHASAITTSATVTCSGFFATGTATTSNQYVGVRVWVGSVFGTALIDSFTNVGAFTYYAPVNSATGAFSVNAGFAVQPPGTVLIARVYGAPTNAFGSWDQGSYTDTTMVCPPRGATITSSTLTCSSFSAVGTGNPADDGFAAMRVWTVGIDNPGGTPLIDSYQNHGVLAVYAPLSSGGSYNISASFPLQPPGTTIDARIYRTETTGFGSWDNAAIQDVTLVCPFPTITPSVTSGKPGKVVTIPGANFGPGEVVKVYWDSTASAALAVPAALSDGSFSATVTIPQATSGTHLLIAVGQTSGRSAQASFLIKPSLLLSPTSGKAGSSVTMIGVGFGPGETVAALWFPGLNVLSIGTSNAVGTVTLSFIVPAVVAGTYYGIGYGVTSKDVAFAPFTVVAGGAAATAGALGPASGTPPLPPYNIPVR